MSKRQIKHSVIKKPAFKLQQEQENNLNIPQKQSNKIYGSLKIQDIKVDRSDYVNILINILQSFVTLMSIYWGIKLLKSQFLSQNQIFNKFQDILLNYNLIIILICVLSVLYFAAVIGYFLINHNYKVTQNNSTRPKLISPLPFILQINQICTYLVLSVNLQAGIILAIISFGVNLIQIAYFQNYILRKSPTYLYSFKINFVLKLIISFWYFGLSLAYNIFNSLLFILINNIFTLILSLWFIISGYKLQNKLNFQFTRILWISLSIFSSLFNTINYFSDRKLTNGSILLQLMLTLVIVSFFFYQTLQKRIMSCLINMQKQLKIDKQTQMLLLKKIQQNQLNDEVAFAHGLVYLHKRSQCSNPKCIYILKQIYDPVTRQNKINNQKTKGINETSLKFMIRCLYKQQINVQSDNVELSLGYCQFLINQFEDSFQINKILNTLNSKQLGFMHKLKILQIRRILHNNHLLFCRNIYSPTLNFQLVLQTETIYNNILTNINNYIQIYSNVWKYLDSSQIQLLHVKNMVEQNQQIMKKVDQNWDKIQQFVSASTTWKASYIHYKYFIKHQKMKTRDIDQISKSTFYQQFQTIDSSRHSLITKRHTFDNNSFIFTAKLINQQLVFYQSSNNFVQITNFKLQQIKQHSVNLLIPQQLHKKHVKSLNEWLNKVKYINEDCYQIKSTKIITKSKKQIPVFKYFKILFDFQINEVIFVCFIKCLQTYKNNKIQQISQLNNKQQQYLTFVNKNGRQLKNISNIFLKQQSFVPVKLLKQLKDTKNIVRILSILMISLILTIFVLTNTQTTNLSNYSKQYLIFIINYRNPFNLGIRYIQYVTNLAPKQSLQKFITNTINSYQQSSNNPLVQRTIFDPNLNNPGTFGPVYVDNITYFNQKFDQNQVYYQALSQVTSLRVLNFSYNDYKFVKFRNYLQPDFDNFFNNTRYNFHWQFIKTFDQISFYQYCQIIIQVIFTVITLSLILYKSLTYFSRIRQIFQTMFQFQASQISVIKQYWRNLSQLYKSYQFKHLSRKLYQSKISSHLNQNNQSTSHILNRRSKKFKIDQEMRGHKIRLVLVLLVYLLISLLVVLLCSLKLISQVQDLKLFQDDGFSILKYFPQVPIMTYSVYEQYMDSKFPDDPIWNAQKYTNNIDALYNYGTYSYVGNVKDKNSPFYTKLKSYYFNTLCDIQTNYELLKKQNYTQQYCRTVFGGAFNQGLTAIMRRQYLITRQVHDGKKTLNQTQMLQLANMTSMMSLFVTDTINSWNSQFIQRVESFNTLYKNLSTLQVLFIILVHLLIFQTIISYFLTYNYKIYRIMFSQMIPQELLQKDKVMRQKFIFENILQKI